MVFQEFAAVCDTFETRCKYIYIYIYIYDDCVDLPNPDLVLGRILCNFYDVII